MQKQNKKESKNYFTRPSLILFSIDLSNSTGSYHDDQGTSSDQYHNHQKEHQSQAMALGDDLTGAFTT